MLWTLLAPLAVGAPLPVKVTEPRAVVVVLDCGGVKTQAPVVKGVAEFATVPTGACTAHLVQALGTIDDAGAWNCVPGTCSQQDLSYLTTSDAPGTVNVLLTDDPPHQQLEIACVDGTRIRGDITNHTVVFQSVPDTDCTLLYKGGPPVQFSPIRWGTWRCQVDGSQAICTQQSRPG
jgi:hypothetical protein